MSDAARSHPQLIAPGTVLAGQYLIGRVLGRGGFGVTYLGRDLALDRRVAIKEYLPRGVACRDNGSSGVVAELGDEEFFARGLERFRDEGQHLAQLEQHPNVVSVKTYLQTNGTGYLVMHYLEGRTLSEYQKDQGGRLPEDKVVPILMQMLDGLRAVHRAGLLHRDLKPDNLFLTEDGHIKLLDFGAAKRLGGIAAQSTMAPLTLHYASPEQFAYAKGEQITLGVESDVYGVGATAYHLLTGQLPVPADERQAGKSLPSPHDTTHGRVSSALSASVMRAMSLAEAERYPSVEPFLKALSGLAAESPEPGTIPVRCPGCEQDFSVGSPGQIRCPFCTAELDVNPERTQVLSLPSRPGVTPSSWLRHPATLATIAGLLVALGITFGVLFSGGGKKPSPKPGPANKPAHVSGVVAPPLSRTRALPGMPAKVISGMRAAMANAMVGPSVMRAPSESRRPTWRPNPDGVEWVEIVGGSFQMGSNKFVVSKETVRPVHKVHVKTFWMAKTEVTVNQYKRCVGAGACTLPWTYDPSSVFRERCHYGKPGYGQHPVNCVTWNQAQAFSKWVLGRLPTEAEWEYAARSRGKAWKYPWGNAKATCEYAVMDDWQTRGEEKCKNRICEGCGKREPWPVCSKLKGNTQQGLCDMSGNVWEWVADFWHATYVGAPSDGSAWISPAGDQRVTRGGDYQSTASDAIFSLSLRCAVRSKADPANYALEDLGFRPAK